MGVKRPSAGSLLVLAGAVLIAAGVAWWVHPGAGLIVAGVACAALGWPS